MFLVIAVFDGCYSVVLGFEVVVFRFKVGVGGSVVSRGKIFGSRRFFFGSVFRGIEMNYVE